MESKAAVLFITGSDSAARDWSGLASGLNAKALTLSVIKDGDAVAWLRTAGEVNGIPVVAFGPDVADPIPLARKIRAMLPASHFVLAPDEARLQSLRHELSRTPMIGKNWSLACAGETSLADHIIRTVATQRRQSELRKTLDRANLEIGTPKPQDYDAHRRFRQSDYYLRDLLAKAYDAIIPLDAACKVLYWSSSASRIFGLGSAKALGRPVEELPFWNPALAALLDDVRETDEQGRDEIDVETSTGPAQLELVLSCVRDDNATVIGFSLVMRDITARNLAQAAERAAQGRIESLASEKEQQRRLFETLLSSTADQSYVLDLEGRCVYANHAVMEQLELNMADVLGKTPLQLGFQREQNSEDPIARLLETRARVRAETRYTAPSGREWFFEYILVPVIDEQGRVEAIAGSSRDITEHRKVRDQVWKEANFDSLTGLPNRRLFQDRLEQEVMRSQRNGAPLALFFIDLDRFKQVNDLHGHNAGDELLRQAAARIRACVREADTVARLGGDEFTVVLTSLAEKAHIENTAEKILDELARPFQIDSSVCYVSGSIGITLYPTDAETPEDLIKNADQAMYEAKNNGRSRFSFFTRALQEAALDRLRLIEDLRHALAKDQFRLYYQPIVNLADGSVFKAEALLRWDHPEHGLLLPGQFISLAEESGRMRELGNWIFRAAAAKSKKWSGLLGQTLQISINKSPVQFEEQGHHMDWAAHLKQAGMPRDSISVEITEGVLLNATDRTAGKLLELQTAGIELAIDDFGTGYSSMAYLKKYDVDYLKIDRSFIHDMAYSASSRTIAESIIAMAHKLGLKVIAEGMETAEQSDWLRAIGCDYAQGFLYSKPVPEDVFEALVQESLAFSV